MLAMLLLIAAPVVGASGNEEADRRWVFVLPSLEGDRFLRSRELQGQVLVNFWNKDCVPCIRELPRLVEFARQHPDWTVLLVATDTSRSARLFLDRQGVDLLAARGGADVAGLMRTAGNRTGALPFSVVLENAYICRTHLGELEMPLLSEWAQHACRRSAIADR